eukprot:snap_masked-scaffold_1-processed-gene-32.33-mRNA-1 protein AED:1.00 eAED:1.00 QI:0/-1/0/0/-1/1/1/0/109
MIARIEEDETTIEENFDTYNTKEAYRVIKGFRKCNYSNVKPIKDADGESIQVEMILKMFQKHIGNTQRYISPESSTISKEFVESYHIVRDGVYDPNQIHKIIHNTSNPR